ncbi:hypothetical protein [Yoonia sediminilitoris]|uniref:Uncharacterized protein n=1 Tax=Yoonia sediminilitoris TaxID=1286148 RepID=A0A2T6KMY0_9RHOB|nr:hypothetical protein [Yoonia sediminilitoris]PUB17578.1 hypothetical protein C8N45_102590 [Yoonia sediminilitoris]RCW97873.1 hypothetical protein DFP92_102590 [Yoonia sediminilitoris]
MQSNLHPADELALVREDMKRLQEREAFLRDGFLRQSWSRRGSEAEVEIKAVHSRVLRRDKLPREIVNDPEYWEDRQVRHVRTKPLGYDQTDDVSLFEQS